jgi:hypothetical protein
MLTDSQKARALMATQMRQMTQTTQAAQATATTFTSQVAALFLMAAGWGWIAGNFVQPANTTWGAVADIIHVIPLAILLAVSLRYIASAATGTVARGARNTITGLVVYGIIGCSVMITLGITNPDPNSVGVHTFEDWMPTIVLNAGMLLWLVTLLQARRVQGGATR